MSEGSRSEKEMSVMELRSELQNNDADGEQEEEEESIIAHLNLR